MGENVEIPLKCAGHGGCIGHSPTPRAQEALWCYDGDARTCVQMDEANSLATVLIIEDDPDMRELERTALTGSGHEVMLAANGREGLRELERRKPCVILLDLMMPVMDGLTFLIERERRGLGTDIPVVCVSAGGIDIMTRAMRLGARHCIQKPADFDELCDRVAYYCGNGSSKGQAIPASQA